MQKNYEFNKVTKFNSINEMLDIAINEAGDKIAFKYKENDEIKEITYKQFQNETIYLGTALHSLGITNTHIAVIGENSYNWITVYLTVLKSNSVIVPVDKELVVVIVVTDQGYVEHKNIELKEVSLEEVKKTVKLINDLIVGTPIDEISAKLEFEIKPVIGKYVRQHEILYNAFYDVFTDISSKNINVVGKNNILKHQEFSNVSKVKDIFDKLEDRTMLENIKESDNNINIYIGHENKMDPDVTVIKTNYKTNKDEGTIAIIGPKRMEYDKVVNLLDYIKKQIER